MNKKSHDPADTITDPLTNREIDAGILGQQMVERGTDPFPMSTGTVVLTLARHLGYRITRRQISTLVEKGEIKVESTPKGHFRFSMEDVLDLAAICEKRRWFYPTARHLRKLTYQEQLEMGFREIEDEASLTVFNQFSHDDLCDLLVTLEITDERERNLVLSLIRARFMALESKLSELT